jgi:hypothetical protein
MATLSSDIILVVACQGITPTFIFALRRICTSWRDAIDAINETSTTWQDLLTAFGMPGQLPHEADKKMAFVLLLCEARCVVQRCAEHAPEGMKTTAHLDDLLLLLNWLLRVGEEAAASWLLPINDVLPREPILQMALTFFSTLSSGTLFFSNYQTRVYEEWHRRAPELAARIASRMQHASQENRRLALASFESLTSKIGVRLLHGLNTFYVKLNHLPTTVSVGQNAVGLLGARLAHAQAGTSLRWAS